MFQPTRTEVRRFFLDAWALHLQGAPAEAQQRVAVACMLEHPEYHDLLSRPQDALEMDFPVERGQQNPFLHLSLHLALEEQYAIDQPQGVRALIDALSRRAGDRHAGLHEAMECLGEVLWQAQRGTLPADMAAINDHYLACLNRRLGAGATPS